jgi:hypothetical protein
VKDAAGGAVKPFTTTNPVNPGPANRRRRRRTVLPPVSNDLNSNLGAAVPPLAGLLPQEALAAGEQIPSGVGFIEGATANAVPVTGGLMTDKKQQVGLIVNTPHLAGTAVRMNSPQLSSMPAQPWHIVCG